MSNLKVGIYVDAINVTNNGGFGLRYDTLRNYACRKGDRIGRANVYLSVDKARLKTDESYRLKVTRFSEGLRDFQFKVMEQPMLQYINKETQQRINSTTVDVDMAVDMLQHAHHLDKVVVLTNNMGYVSVIRAVQQAGCRVELIWFDNISSKLRKEADVNISGYLIPGLLPINSEKEWGEVGSRVRGICYDYNQSEGYGFMRYIKQINNHMWVSDSREAISPYQTVFAHVSQFEKEFKMHFLPSRELIFEFTLGENEKGLIAEEIQLVSAP